MTIPQWVWKAATGALGATTVGLGAAVVLQNRAIKSDSKKLATMDNLIRDLQNENAHLQQVFKDFQSEGETKAKVVALGNLTNTDQDNEEPRTA